MILSNILSDNRKKAFLYLIIANLIWGFASPIFKLSLKNITPFTLAFIRFAAASLLLLPFVYKNLKVYREDYSKLFLLSFFGITVNISFFFLGLQYAPSINAPIIGSSGPVFLYIFSIIILHEKPHYKVLVGTIISLIGVLTIVGQPLISKSQNVQLLGNLFFVLATFGAVAHAIISKEILNKYHSTTITFWSFIIGSISFLPLFIFEIVKYNPLANLDGRGIMGIIFGVFLSSALAYSLYEWGIKNIDAQDIGVFTYIDPLAAIILAIPLLGEKITPLFVIGSLLVFLGIYVAEGRLHWHPLHKLKN